MPFCPECGARITEGGKFCPECGASAFVVPAPEPAVAEPAPETVVAEPVPVVEVTEPAPEPVVVQSAPEPEVAPQPAEQVPELKLDYEPEPIPQPEPAPEPAPEPQPQYTPPQQQYQAPQYAPPPIYSRPPQSPPPPPYQEPPYRGISIMGVYRQVFAKLLEKPLMLWGLSLLFVLLCGLACSLAILPIVYLPIVFCLQVGMIAVFLDGYRGREINSKQLFRGFEKGNFLRFAAGMGWMYLWVLLWSLIPIAGVVFGIIKAYSYRFTPYILLSDPDISAADALRQSMRMTDGYKGKMFGADVIIVLLFWAALLVLGLLGQIPFAGAVFMFVAAVLVLLFMVFSTLVFGLIKAAMYEEVCADIETNK